MALAEACVQGGVGFQGRFRLPGRWDVFLFGERQSRIVASLDAGSWDDMKGLAEEFGVPIQQLGTTGDDRFRIGSSLDLPLQEISDAWNHGLEQAL